jgi:hypothetical protein
MWYISIILMVLAGIFNACMDVLKVRFKTSIFSTWKGQQWINPALSWTNKWKPTTKIGDLIMSTVLIWVTDMWHFVKMLMLACISLAIVFYLPVYKWWADIFIMYFAFTGTFELFFSKILIKK